MSNQTRLFCFDRTGAAPQQRQPVHLHAHDHRDQQRRPAQTGHHPRSGHQHGDRHPIFTISQNMNPNDRRARVAAEFAASCRAPAARSAGPPPPRRTVPTRPLPLRCVTAQRRRHRPAGHGLHRDHPPRRQRRVLGPQGLRLFARQRLEGLRRPHLQILFRLLVRTSDGFCSDMVQWKSARPGRVAAKPRNYTKKPEPLPIMSEQTAACQPNGPAAECTAMIALMLRTLRLPSVRDRVQRRAAACWRCTDAPR